MKYARRRKKRRLKRMAEVLQVMHLLEFTAGLTAYQLAFWLNMKPSGHFYAILRHMESIGWIAGVAEQHRPGVTKTRWHITPNGVKMVELNFRPDAPLLTDERMTLTQKAKDAMADEIQF